MSAARWAQWSSRSKVGECSFSGGSQSLGRRSFLRRVQGTYPQARFLDLCRNLETLDKSSKHEIRFSVAEEDSKLGFPLQR